MVGLFKINHSIDGVASDLGGFPYSQGGNQNVIKKYVIHDNVNESDIDEENQGGKPYVSYVSDVNVTRIAFMIQESERSLFTSLKYHNSVIFVDDNLTEHELINVNVEVSDSGSYGKYLCIVDIKSSDSYIKITGNEL